MLQSTPDLMNWTAETWAVIFGSSVTIGGGLVAMFGVFFKLGGLNNDFLRITKRVEDLESQAKLVEAKLNTLEILKMSIDDLKRQMTSLRRDIIQLLRGKIKIIPMGDEEDEAQGE